MEGGVAIFLLLVIAAVAVVFAIAMYITGGAILTSRSKRETPPRGKTDPVAENTTAMKTPERREHSEHSSAS
jgi:hypothetical protein